MYYTNSYTSSQRKPLNFVQWYKKLIQIFHKGSLNIIIIKLCLLLIISSWVRDRERESISSYTHECTYTLRPQVLYTSTSMVRCALSKCCKSQCKRGFWRTIPRADTVIYQGLSKKEVHQSYHTTVTYMPHGFEDEYLLG